MRPKMPTPKASCFAVVLAALSLAARAGAQPAPSIDYVHVCGVALGMSQAQAEHAAKRNIHQASFAKRQGVLHGLSPAAGPILFGEDISDGSNPKLGDASAVTQLSLTFGLQPNHPVIYIERREDFAAGQGPDLSGFIGDLEAEYGQPNGIERSAGHLTIVFDGHSSVAYSAAGADSRNCLAGIRQFARAAHDGAFSATLGNRSTGQIEGCGTWLVYDLSTSTGKQPVINSLTETLGHGGALAHSIGLALNPPAAGGKAAAMAPSPDQHGNKPQA